MRQQERFRWSLWPVITGWMVAAWVGWSGLDDLRTLATGGWPIRSLLPGFVSSWPREAQWALALLKCGALVIALPSFLGWLTGRVLISVGDRGITIERWRGFRHLDWDDVERLDMRWGDALFTIREQGHLNTLRFRPWTIGMDTESFRALIERHQPRLTPDEDDGQPWGRSSSFN